MDKLTEAREYVLMRVLVGERDLRDSEDFQELLADWDLDSFIGYLLDNV